MSLFKKCLHSDRAENFQSEIEKCLRTMHILAILGLSQLKHVGMYIEG